MNQMKQVEQMVQELAQEIIKSGDTQFATQYKNKKHTDCATALYSGMAMIAAELREGKNCCGVFPSLNVFRSAIVHWYTEDKPTIESIADILKGECDHIALNVNKGGSTPKPTPKAEPIKTTKPKATTPKAAPAKPATPAPAPKPTMQILKPSAEAVPTQEVEEFDDLDLDDFDPLD